MHPSINNAVAFGFRTRSDTTKDPTAAITEKSIVRCCHCQMNIFRHQLVQVKGSLLYLVIVVSCPTREEFLAKKCIGVLCFFLKQGERITKGMCAKTNQKYLWSTPSLCGGMERTGKLGGK